MQQSCSGWCLFGIKTEVIDSLLSWVATAFMTINSTLPSSAAVERLFSAAAQVLTARRCHMSDETLNQYIFIRSQFNVTGERYAGKDKTKMA